MPNSSNWMAALEAAPDTAHSGASGASGASPAWIEALLSQGEFTEGLPAARRSVPETRPPISPEILASHAPSSAPSNAPSISPSNGQSPDPVAEAFARGEAAGLAKAKEAHDAAAEHQRSLRLTFRTFDQAAMDSLASELADTVIGLCGQAFSDFVPTAENLHTRCEAAAKRLGGAVEDCALHLNPQDIEMLDAKMLDQWRVVGDDAVQRGGLHFEGSNGSISDGPSDWHRAIASALRG